MAFMIINNAYPDETPQYAASHLGLHCLQASHLWDDTDNRVTCNRIFSNTNVCLHFIIIISFWSRRTD